MGVGDHLSGRAAQVLGQIVAIEVTGAILVAVTGLRATTRMRKRLMALPGAPALVAGAPVLAACEATVTSEPDRAVGAQVTRRTAANEICPAGRSRRGRVPIRGMRTQDGR